MKVRVITLLQLINDHQLVKVIAGDHKQSPVVWI